MFQPYILAVEVDTRFVPTAAELRGITIEIKAAVNCLKKAGHREISIFMICNHPAVSYKENILKLDLCKYWHCKVNDCYFDNQTSPGIIPIAWTNEQIKLFRKKVRKHNQIVGFGIDPEL